MQVIYESATLQSETKNDGLKFWRIKAYKTPEGAFTQSESWKSTAGGTSKPVISAPTRVEGKNLGRSNATTDEQQAVLEAQAEERKKKERKGYWILGQDKPADALDLPMLAEKYSERSHDLLWPVATQPKLDGVRALLDGSKAWSRQGKPFIQDVVQHLLFDTGGVTLDGELMLPHDQYTFQQTTSAVKKYGPLSKELVYFVYDLVMPGETFRERHLVLQELAKAFPANVRLVDTGEASNEVEVLAAQGRYTEAGFEGTMLRNWSGDYLVGHRSADLQKYKAFDTEEFPVVAVEQGVARFEGCATFVCKTKSGQEFRATPKGTLEEKKAFYARRAELIGKQVTVQYQGMGDGPNGAPRFPIVLAVRDYE